MGTNPSSHAAFYMQDSQLGDLAGLLSPISRGLSVAPWGWRNMSGTWKAREVLASKGQKGHCSSNRCLRIAAAPHGL